MSGCLLASGLLLFATITQASGETPVDPFADLQVPVAPTPAAPASSDSSPGNSSLWELWPENLTLKKEIYSQVSYRPREVGEANNDLWYSRQSAGFELLKKFSTERSTIAAFDVQARLVRRDNVVPVINDEEGADRDGWFAEYHNIYLDLYNVLNPVLPDDVIGTAAGHFNFRVGRFYFPLGLNLQTDTHGTLLQLSNERNLGFERDWEAGFYGSVNRSLNYDLYYLLGSGYDPAFRGQSGMVACRVSLASRLANEYGIEGGVAVVDGQRKSNEALNRSASVAEEADDGHFIDTVRYGADLRYSHLLLSGTVAGTAELTTGTDESDHVFTQLYQLDYLHRSRQWGLSSQFRRFHQTFRFYDPARYDDADASIIGELTWYFRNDIGNTNLHWIKLNVERQLERMEGRPGTVTTIQYYRYW